MYMATRSAVCSFTRTAHSLPRSITFYSRALRYLPRHSLAHSLTRSLALGLGIKRHALNQKIGCISPLVGRMLSGCWAWADRHQGFPLCSSCAKTLKIANFATETRSRDAPFMRMWIARGMERQFAFLSWKIRIMTRWRGIRSRKTRTRSNLARKKCSPSRLLTGKGIS